jgi:ABC-type antimicrobial peptide transport system permease subunit
VIVNDTIARRLWPSGDPIGQRLRVASVDETWREVVGIAQTGPYDDLTESPASYIYLPLDQSPPASLTLVARAQPGAGSALPVLQAIVRDLDPQLPVVDVRTFDEVIARSVDKQRAASALLAAFGGLAALLAALGIYGVMSHATMQRVHEIWIRMALGARPPQIRQLFVRESLKLSLAGCAIGVAIAAGVSRLLSGFLFGLAPADALMFALGGAVMCGAAILAAYFPARRAVGLRPFPR